MKKAIVKTWEQDNVYGKAGFLQDYGIYTAPIKRVSYNWGNVFPKFN